MSNHESAFGRPAQWRTALPAVVVGGCACLLALYGRYTLPRQLPQHYTDHLQQSAESYDAIRNISSMAAGSRLISIAGERDVVFERLVALEQGSPERYWEWFEFLNAHAQYVREQLADPAVSISERYREPLQEQTQLFEAKSTEILAQLSATDSDLRERAVLQLAERQFERSFLPSSSIDMRGLMKQLQPLVEAEATTLEAEELRHARWLYAATCLEAAWQHAPGSRLQCDQQLIGELSKRFEDLMPSSPVDARAAGRWLVLAELLNVYHSPDYKVNPPADQEREGLGIASSDDWRGRLASLQLAAIRAEWQEVEYLLPASNDDQAEIILTGLARTLCRLVCSRAAHDAPEWAEAHFAGALMAGRLAPQLPEWSELLWEAGKQMADAATESVPSEGSSMVADRVVNLMAASEEPLLIGTLQAIKACLQNDATALEQALDDLSAFEGGTHLVARVCVWRAQSLDEDVLQSLADELDRLSRGTVAAEPNSGFNWFGLGLVQFRLQDMQAAEEALAKADQLTLGAPAVKEALNAVKAAKNRMGNL